MDLLFRGVHVQRFWVGEWLSSKSDVHRTVAVETVMQYLGDGTINVKEGDDMDACCDVAALITPHWALCNRSVPSGAPVL